MPGVQKAEFQSPDRFLVTYDSSAPGVIEAARQAVEALGYGVKEIRNTN